MDISMNDVELIENAKWNVLGWWKTSHILYMVPYFYIVRGVEKFRVLKVKGFLEKGTQIEMKRGISLP